VRPCQAGAQQHQATRFTLVTTRTGGNNKVQTPSGTSPSMTTDQSS
jgi:hypothetical protein